ncbi:hypothetical protein [uncultured Tenacibaculum sp.]|uniref:hypothetical protein n=1 Tax=uncultured Tenacibaculum sp. TaxID=174713 RepID=UPI00261777A7|nr:hypothetical protein [uncultured Tenacibaculum sp.]
MEFITIILIGCLVVTIFDALGSILSRILKFKYVWLTFGSILIYGTVALYAAKHGGIIWGVIGSCIVGVFDSTIGSLISIKLKANIPEDDVTNLDITPKLVISVAIFASIIGLITVLLFG